MISKNIFTKSEKNKLLKIKKELLENEYDEMAEAVEDLILMYS